MRFKFRLKYIGLSLLIAWGVMGLSALATMGNQKIYDDHVRPSFAPSGKIFPIVWGILFTLMAASSYLIMTGNASNKTRALTVYYIQLAVNFFWGIIFFNFQSFLFAFIWLCILFLWILSMIREFYLANRLAAYLQIPYALWVIFAGILNLSIYLLNR